MQIDSNKIKLKVHITRDIKPDPMTKKQIWSNPKGYITHIPVHDKQSHTGYTIQQPRLPNRNQIAKNRAYGLNRFELKSLIMTYESDHQHGYSVWVKMFNTNSLN